MKQNYISPKTELTSIGARSILLQSGVQPPSQVDVNVGIEANQW